MTPHLADTPILETERLTLRAPQMDDYPVWEAFFHSDRSRYIGGPGDTRTAWRAFAHATGMWALRGYGSFVFARKDNGAPLGLSGPWNPMDWPEPEIGWTVWVPEAEGQGYALEAASVARDFAFRELGWSTAVSYIDQDNLRSIALAERLGAWRDDDAEKPDQDEPPALVYRHPRPEGTQ